MGVDDVGIIGVGKDSYNSELGGMINGRIIPWVEDAQDDEFPVWTDYNAAQRSTYILNREGDLIYQFNITTLDPTEPEDYEYLINLILDYRSTNGPSVFRIPEDTTSIQGGIEWAENGDIVLVSPGIYQERIDFLDKNISVASLLYSGFDQSMFSETIIDGEHQGTVVTINGGQNHTAILTGLTIENGFGSQTGGGILIENSSPKIGHNIIRNNNAGDCGGEGAGLAIWGESQPIIIGNKFYENVVSGLCDCICYFGGGIYVDSTAYPVIGSSENLGNIFFENYSDYGFDLFRNPPTDTTDWAPIFAHDNTFENCPPEFFNHVFPQNGWDLENCRTLLSIEKEQHVITNGFYLFPNYPNPFNPTTTISFDLVNPQFSSNPHLNFINEQQAINKNTVSLRILDITGRLVETLIDQTLFPGIHEIRWNASYYPSGIYFIQLRFGEITQTQKAVFVK
mgnify:CR=1 FL=1|tara:strand:+ start:673 stop:2034 length:1362 start_codon:yes stop_codon:yes gene_type:complete